MDQLIEYLNTDNGQVVQVPERFADRYERACNMERIKAAPAAPEDGDLSALTLKDLKALAAERGVEVPKAAKKDDLVALLSAPPEPSAPEPAPDAAADEA